jgi:hypothetical protein
VKIVKNYEKNKRIIKDRIKVIKDDKELYVKNN